MKVLHVIGTLDPAYGGPVEGLRQLTKAVSALGHTVEHLTLDSVDAPWLASWPYRFHALGPSYGRYRFNSRIQGWLEANASRFDVIVVHGIWQYHGLATWRAATESSFRYVVFTHGALDPWFKLGHPLKHLKKAMYWRLLESRILRDASAVLFTTEEERQLARESFRPYQVKERVIGYGLNKPDPSSATEAFLKCHPEAGGRRLILFMSRLHKKKGLDLLIRAFCAVAAGHPDITLAVAGPDEQQLKPELMKILLARGLADRVLWLGMIQGEVKKGALQTAEAFCLPSHSENFGIVVAEALSQSCPVLISNKVNIWREVESEEAGIVEPDTLEGTEKLLRRWIGLGPSARQTFRHNAQRCYENHFNVGKTVQRFVGVLEAVARTAPDA